MHAYFDRLVPGPHGPSETVVAVHDLIQVRASDRPKEDRERLGTRPDRPTAAIVPADVARRLKHPTNQSRDVASLCRIEIVPGCGEALLGVPTVFRLEENIVGNLIRREVTELAEQRDVRTLREWAGGSQRIVNHLRITCAGNSVFAT